MKKNTAKNICLNDRELGAEKARTVKGGALNAYQPVEANGLIGLLVPAAKTGVLPYIEQQGIIAVRKAG